MPLFPPIFYNMVDEGIYRCGAPTSLNFEVRDKWINTIYLHVPINHFLNKKKPENIVFAIIEFEVGRIDGTKHHGR